MKKRIKHILILETAAVLFCISLIAKQDKNPISYTPTNTPVLFQDTKLSESIQRGEGIYIDFCMQCHLADGKGTPKVFPPLAGSDWLTDKRTESLYSLKYGLNGPIKVNGQTYNSTMTPLGLEDEEIADVMNYIMNSWGNTQEKMVTEKEVSSIKK